MPTPNKDESKEDFIKRCVPILISEGKDNKQAVAVCYSLYTQHKTKAWIERSLNKNEHSTNR